MRRFAPLILGAALLAALATSLPARSANPVPAALSPISLTKDIETSPGSLSFSSITPVGGAFYGLGNTNANGIELWRTDGTSAPQQVIDLHPGRESANAYGLTAVGQRLFFFAESKPEDFALWRTDGTAASTQRVRSFGGRAGAPPVAPLGPLVAALGGKLLFQASTDLWVSDGTASGTVKIFSFTAINDLRMLGDRVLLLATSADTGYGLWSSDGTAAGTQQIRTFNSATQGKFTFADGKLYFSANGGAGCQVFVTDGTASGTALFANACGGFTADTLTISGGRFYFATVVGFAPPLAVLQRSGNGTPTMETVKQFDTEGLRLTGIAPAGSGVVFSAAQESVPGSRQLWVSDGTPTGTVSITSGTAAPTVGENGQSSGGTVFASSYEGPLWRSDGTVAGTSVITPTVIGRGFVHSGAQLYFTGNTVNGPAQLWRSDGTVAGTQRMVQLTTSTSSAFPDLVSAAANQVVFVAPGNPSQSGIWRSDGTTAGTVEQVQRGQPVVTDLASFGDTTLAWLRQGSVDPQNVGLFRLRPGDTALQPVLGGSSDTIRIYPRSSLIVAQSNAFFLADYENNPTALYRTDGTVAGTSVITDSQGFESFTPSGSEIYYTGAVSALGTFLYRTDRAAPGGVRIVKPFSGSVSPPIIELRSAGVVGNRLYFTVYVDSDQYRLWTTDGTEAGTVAVSGMTAETGRLVRYLGTIGNTLYVVFGHTLYAVSDTAATKVTDLAPSGEVNIAWGQSVGAYVVFTMSNSGGTQGFDPIDPAHSLWRTDGTAVGTVRLFSSGGPQVYAGQSYVDTASSVALPSIGQIAFTGYTPGSGAELWVTDGTAAGTRLAQDLAPGPQSSTPQRLTIAGNRLFMIADNGQTGLEVYAARIGDLRDGLGRTYLPILRR